MIKMSAANAKSGRPLILLGLSYENLKRLKRDMPIHIHADELGFVGEIVIFAGRTEASMQSDLAELIGPQTVVRDHTKMKRQ